MAVIYYFKFDLSKSLSVELYQNLKMESIPREILFYPTIRTYSSCVFSDDPEKSGKWDIAYDSRRFDIFYLKNISTLVHLKVFDRSEDVKTALVVERELHFHHHPDFKPIKLDVLRYSIHEQLVRPEEKPHFYHITKGLGPDSIYFLEPSETDKKIVYLDQLVCDMTMKY